MMMSGDVEPNPGPCGILTPDNLIDVMTELCEEVSAEWENVGLALGLKPGILNAIKGPYKNPQDCLRDMLKEWLNRSPDPRWHTLIQALRNPTIGKERLAKHLEGKYFTREGSVPPTACVDVVPRRTEQQMVSDEEFFDALEKQPLPEGSVSPAGVLKKTHEIRPLHAESQVLNEVYARLYECIHNADALAMQLYSNGLIAKDLRTSIEDTTEESEKNTLLLGALVKVVSVNSRRLDDVLQVFNGEPYLQGIVEAMRGALKRIHEQVPKRTKLTSPYAEATNPPDYIKSEYFLEFLRYLKRVYRKVLLPDRQTKWPMIRFRKAVNLACIKREPYDPFQADDFTLSTIHGNIDDVLHYKEQIKLQQVACRQEDGSFQDCVLVSGAPGVGKTTLSQLLCREWMEGRMLQWYSVVLLLRLREEWVQEASQIEDLFFYLSKQTKECVAREIEVAQGSHVLLILEGFDELPQELQLSGFLIDLITGKRLPDATKLITSRHSATTILNRWANITQHVEVLGFTKADIEEYTVSELEFNQPLLESFRKYLSRYGFIKSMMYVPLSCAIVVEVYKSQRNKAKMAKTSAELYDSLLRTLLLRYLLATPPYNTPSMVKMPCLDSIEQLPGEVLTQLMHLCEIAYDGIMQQKLIFSENPGDHLGLMDAVTQLYVDGVKCSYNFLHLTLQEFLAALHLYIEWNKESSGSLSVIFEKHMDHPQVLIFLAGLTKLNTFNRDNLKHNIFIADSSKLSSTIRWLFEAQDQDLIRDVLCEGTVKYKPADTLTPTPFDCHSLGYCIAHSTCQWQIDLSDCGLHDERLLMLAMGATSDQVTHGRVTQLDLRNNQLTSEGLQALANTPFLKAIREFNISKNKVDAQICTTLATDFLQAMPNLEDICLSLNTLGSGSTVPLLQALHTLPHLRELGMYDTGIGYKDINILCEKLPEMEDLDLLDIGNNHLSPDSVNLIVETLLSCVPLKRLAMSYTVLSDHQVDLLAMVLRENHNLQGLYLQGCEVHTQGACQLAAALSEPDCTLKILSLNENNIGHAGGMALADAVAVNTSLFELHLGKADIGKEATLLILENHRKHASTNIKRFQLSRKYKPRELNTTSVVSWQ